VPSRAVPSRTRPSSTGPSRTEPAGQRAAGAASESSGRPYRAGRDLPGWLAVLLPVVAELVVGGYRLGGPSLWRDEAYTLDAAQRSFSQILSLLLHFDAVHGPYYLGMHVVVSALGKSEVALRLPSLLATSLAAGVTAALGRRLARLTGLPAPRATGLLAGLLLVAAPLTTYYAQNARPYGLVTLFAVTATYLLAVAAERGGARWWAAYAAAITLTGMASLFALLILAAHGVTLIVTRGRARLLPWLAGAAAAILVLSPLIVLGYGQDKTLGWVSRPGAGTVILLVSDFAGSRPLIAVVLALALCGIAAGLGGSAAGVPRWREFTVVTVALPWLVLPPLILLVVSAVKPVYVERYVVFCQPALALLCAAGLAWLARLIARSPAGRRVPALAWATPLVLLAVLAAGLAGPQQAVRRTSARPDNLRGVSAVMAANERPGDAVFYLPSEARVVSMAYPAPFGKLRDLALERSPAASDSLTGTQVWAPVLARRFAGPPRVRRVWLVQWAGQLSVRPDTKIGREELVLTRRMHLVRRWTVQSVVLSLYAAGQS
jgi:mannosyltransferase